MPLVKYKFNPGEGCNSENVNSIDPDNIPAQAAGLLTGGANPSALSVFQTLANGANDGKIKINIDGTVYDNLAVDLKIPAASPTTIYTNGNGAYGSQQALNINWTAIAKFKLTSFNPYVWDVNSDRIEVRIGGVLVATSDTVQGAGGGTTIFPFTGANQIVVAAGTVLNIQLIGGNGRNDGSQLNWYIAGNAYATVASTAEIATALQAAIRVATTKTETVVYSTNKYVITSCATGLASKILKLMTPSTGTNISGAGATAYLDCAANATETLGTGIEYYLPRLNRVGVLAVPIKNNAQVGTTYTLVLDDPFKYVLLTNASAIAVTIPTNAVVAFPIGTEIYLIQGGAGKVTLSGAGVTINSLSSYKSIAGAGGQATLVKIATDTWQLYGNLIA